MNPYGTHREALLASLWYTRKSKGPVLECGAGDFSTRLLHEVCAAQGRKLVTLETDAAWLKNYTSLASSDHELRLVTSWEAAGEWDVALVDCNPGFARGPLVNALSGRVKYIVIHDTEPANVHEYNYNLERFIYRRDYTDHLPYTSVVSNLLKVWDD